ncbi:hypothetical protein HYC85_011593 [Camellia sinensis]|uniref:Uncharacterized protein n=1 Tax=Camellia sinensis TaxID=4442 RepID=A0A7J7H9H8_CAMSI|nr:hypothetical protein HYC85_011593 [Camellia sinensis]
MGDKWRVEMDQNAYIKMILHALKHRNSSVKGLLFSCLSSASADFLHIVDSVPFFHFHFSHLLPIEITLTQAKERALDVRPMEFTLYEEALRGGLRLPISQIVVEVLNWLKVAPGQLMSNA